MKATTALVAVLFCLAVTWCEASTTCKIILSTAPLNLQGGGLIGAVQGKTAAGTLATANFSCSGDEVNVKVSQALYNAVADKATGVKLTSLGNSSSSEITLTFENGNITITDSTFAYLRNDMPLSLVFRNSSVRVTRSTFNANAAPSYGALLAVLESSNLSMDNTSMTGNAASAAAYGLIYVDGVSSASLASVEAQSNANNAAAGGVITVTGGSSVYVGKANFINNAANIGAVVYANDSSTVRLYENTFFNNTAAMMGGAVAVIGSDLFENSTSFLNNSAAQGGALYLQDTEASISGSLFFNNLALSGAGVFQSGCPGGLTTATSFTANEAQNGGGLYQIDCEADITNTKFEGNVAKLGSAIFQVDSPGAVSSVIFNFTATDQVANSFYSINSGPINFQELIFVPSDAKQSAVFSSN